MKKMFFTAVALMAFSATSMANTVEVKEVAIEETKVEAVVKRTPCDDFYASCYTLYLSQHGGNPGLTYGDDGMCNGSAALDWCDAMSTIVGC